MTSVASAATPVVLINAVAIGDSYTAGNGAGDYVNTTCFRSPHNWANRYVDYLNSTGKADALLENLACSGAVTSQILEQVKDVPADTNLVMFTAGGNDVGFSDIVTACFSSAANGKACKSKVEAAKKGLPGVVNNTTKILQALDAKLSDKTKIVFVGYPYLAPNDRKWKLCTGYNWLGWCNRWYEAAVEVRRLQEQARVEQIRMANKWNLTHATKITYIDMLPPSNGHEPSPWATSNSKRWVNEFADGIHPEEWYHLNAEGHRQVALLIQQKLGVPKV